MERPASAPDLDLRVIADRARLSLECYRYTGNSYWLECALDDCRQGRLDWNQLCELALGKTIPLPKSTNR